MFLCSYFRFFVWLFICNALFVGSFLFGESGGRGGGEGAERLFVCLFSGLVNRRGPYYYHVDLCNESCSFGRPSVDHPFCVAKTLMLDITRGLSNQRVSYLP